MKQYEKYKDSGNQWLGMIPSHWEMLRNKVFITELDEKVGKRTDLTLLSLTKGGVIERDVESGKGKFPKDFESYKEVLPGNMIFCLFDVDETPRTVGLSEKSGMITGAYNVYAVSGINPKYYLSYFTAVDNAKALRPLYSGLRKVVKSDRFLAMRIPIPPTLEQEKIVDFLDAKTLKIDECICLRERESYKL